MRGVVARQQLATRRPASPRPGRRARARPPGDVPQPREQPHRYAHARLLRCLARAPRRLARPSRLRSRRRRPRSARASRSARSASRARWRSGTRQTRRAGAATRRRWRHWLRRCPGGRCGGARRGWRRPQRAAISSAMRRERLDGQRLVRLVVQVRDRAGRDSRRGPGRGNWRPRRPALVPRADLRHQRVERQRPTVTANPPRTSSKCSAADFSG